MMNDNYIWYIRESELGGEKKRGGRGMTNRWQSTVGAKGLKER